MKKKWNVYLTVGLILTGLMVFAALLGSFWTPYVPTAMNTDAFRRLPSPTCSARTTSGATSSAAC